MIQWFKRRRARNSVQPLVVQNLREGDIIQHRVTGKAFVVTANYGEYAIAVRTTHVSNPSEWKLVKHNAEREVRT